MVRGEEYLPRYLAPVVFPFCYSRPRSFRLWLSSERIETNTLGHLAPRQIFSQHESHLRKHLNVVGMIKTHVQPQSEAFTTVSAMLDRTNELLSQMELARKEFVRVGFCFWCSTTVVVDRPLSLVSD